MNQREAFAARFSLQWRQIAQRLSSALLALVALSLIILGRIDQPLIQGVRARVADLMAPIFMVARQPLASISASLAETRGLFDLAAENERLREENARLKAWEAAAYRLESQNQVLRGMVDLAPDAPAILKTEPVIADPGGVYVQSVLVGGGAVDGIAKGQAALVGSALVGRVTELGAWSARVLLIDDLNSRIPVMLEGTRAHAILAGDNSPLPRLLYLPKAAQVDVGDRVVTEGHDGVFPTGLAVGRVSSVDHGEIRVRPIADLDRLEYVELIDSAAVSALTPEAAPAPAPSP